MALVLGLAAIGVAFAAMLAQSPPPRIVLTLTAGCLETTRAHVARALAAALAEEGLATSLIETTSTEEALEALDRFSAGDLGDQAATTDLLTPINAARDHIGGLVLHVRDNLEERADAEGRASTALWAEAIGKPHDEGG